MIQQVASSSFPEKSAGRAAVSSAECEDMAGAGGARGVGLVAGGEGITGDEGIAGDEGGKGWGFP